MNKQYRWHPAVKLKVIDGKVLVTNYITNKKYFISSKLLFRKLKESDVERLEEKGILTSKSYSVIDKGIQHWEKRNWVPSLDFYLTSRNIKYADRNDITGKVIREVLEKYSKEEDPPMRGKPSILSKVNLKIPSIKDTTQLTNIIFDRRSIREYDRNRPILFSELEYILVNGNKKILKTRKLAETEGSGNSTKSYGKAFDIYIAVYNVKDLKQGVYYYDIENNQLHLINQMDISDKLPPLMGNQNFSKTAGMTIFIVADWKQYQWLYRHNRALRQLYVEAGRAMEHILLAALKVGINGVVTPAILDRKVAELLKLDIVRQLPIYTFTLGKEVISNV